MIDAAPTFPPLLCGHGLSADENPLDWAHARARDRKLSAGDLVWSKARNQLRFALVLEPEVERDRCAEMAYVAMVAFGDAAGALIPPEVAITYQWPNVIQMNDGQIGSVDLIVSETAANSIPDWMVLSVDIQLTPDQSDFDPGENYHRTTFWDEGCGEITSIELLESTSRHLVNAIHTWAEDGFRPIHDTWRGRLNKENPLVGGLGFEHSKFIGVDETGNGLLRTGDKTTSFAFVETLDELRKQSHNCK